jgi:hypothetical protein
MCGLVEVPFPEIVQNIHVLRCTDVHNPLSVATIFIYRPARHPVEKAFRKLFRARRKNLASADGQWPTNNTPRAILTRARSQTIRMAPRTPKPTRKGRFRLGLCVTVSWQRLSILGPTRTRIPRGQRNLPRTHQHMTCFPLGHIIRGAGPSATSVHPVCSVSAPPPPPSLVNHLLFQLFLHNTTYITTLCRSIAYSWLCAPLSLEPRLRLAKFRWHERFGTRCSGMKHLSLN